MITLSGNHQIEAIPAEIAMELSLELHELLETYTANVEKTLKTVVFCLIRQIPARLTRQQRVKPL